MRGGPKEGPTSLHILSAERERDVVFFLCFLIGSQNPSSSAHRRLVRARSLDTLPIGLMGELGSAVVPRGALGMSYNEWIPQKSETTSEQNLNIEYQEWFE